MEAIRDIHRKTKSICPICLKDSPAEVASSNGRVYLIKKCPEHGESKALLSLDPEYHIELDSFYFSVMKSPPPQRDFLIRLTEECNLTCPICLASANQNPFPDYDAENLYKFIRGRKKKTKIDLMSAEPTLRKDLMEIIREIRRHGHTAALHTNGIKLANPDYVKELKDAGISEVFLQFDGMRDDIYEKVRGAKLLNIKLKCIENLKKEGISTNLTCTIVRGVNEDVIPEVIDFAVRQPHIKEIFFLGCRNLGYARKLDESLNITPDELIDLAEKSTAGLISREKLLTFQMLYFSLLSIFRVRKCPYVQHYMLVRDDNGVSYHPIDSIINLRSLRKGFRYFKEMKEKERWYALLYFASLFAPEVLNLKAWRLLREFLTLHLLLKRGFDLSRVSRKIILLGFITACDPYIFDHQISMFCGKGEISNDQGILESGALANIERERLYLRNRR